MDTNQQALKVMAIAADIKNLLPYLGKAEITLTIETPEEVKEISKKLNVSFLEPPHTEFNHSWCMYRSGPVNITIQSPDMEEKQETSKYKLNHN